MLAFLYCKFSKVENSSLFYYTITARANDTVLVLSVLLIIAGLIMTATSICQLTTGMWNDFKMIENFYIEIVRYMQ